MLQQDLLARFTNALKGNKIKGMTTIDYPHKEVHSGSHFYVCGFDTLATDATLSFSFVTPNTTKWAHVTFDISGTSRTEFYIYEVSTSTGGTPVVPFNNNRNSVKASVMVIASDPTNPTTGNLIFSQSKGLEGTTPSRASSQGITRRENEIILKQNTKYCFVIKSKDDDNIVDFCGEWYEHTDEVN